MKQCPLTDQYRFRTKCSIKTCKYYSETTNSNCIGIDTKFAAHDKPITDSELVMYKFPNMNAREVAGIRKRSVNRVQAVISLSKIVAYVRTYEQPSDGLNAALLSELPLDVEAIVRKTIRSKVFKIQPLNLEVWMLPFVVDTEYTNQIGVSLEKFAPYLLFKLTAKEYERMSIALNQLRKSRGQSKTETADAS